MTRAEPIAVFAYAFAHRKTQDFLLELAAAGFENVTVLGAQWKALSHSDPNTYFPIMLRPVSAVPTSAICRALGFEFYDCEHDDAERILELKQTRGFKLGIIAGARIIRSAVINIFDEGILNIHPGKLPETSGLDLFFYTILKRVPMGVTTHYIDARVDAGDELFFEETVLGPDDTIEVVQYNNYQTQIKALRRFIRLRDEGALVRRPVDRPRKNEPMAPDQKRSAVMAFPSWRAFQYKAQKGRALHAACRNGDATGVREILAAFPDLIETRSPEGWTPLIMAAHGQHGEAVRALLECGADPNGCGRRGTTVLMYAKSRLLGQRKPEFSLLNCLLDYGADPSRTDSLGHDIYYYLRGQGDTVISGWLARWKSKS